MEAYFAGVYRIWVEDRSAIYLRALLVLVQLGIFLVVLKRTGKPLSETRSKIDQIARRLQAGGTPSEPELRAAGEQIWRAWRLCFGERPGVGTSDPADAEAAFDPTRLLPGAFNGRLDAAAPGLFTAVGIAGTFVGLILGFMRVDPANATISIGPLVGGMVVAFVNSLVGVLLSIVWSWRSRTMRHHFDCSAHTLLAQAELREQPKGPTHRILDHFESLTAATLALHGRMDVGMSEIRNGLSALDRSTMASATAAATATRVLQERLDSGMTGIETAVGKLHESTADSSRELLENLSPRIQESFKTLVNLPFDRLDESIARFDTIVRDAAGAQERIAEQVASSTTTLGNAEQQFAATIISARETVDRFLDVASTLKAQGTVMTALLEQTRGAAEGLGAIAAEVREAAVRYGDAGDALVGVTAGLASTSEALREQTNEFGSAAASLHATVDGISEITRTGAEQGVAAVRGELQQAVREMVSGLRDVGETTVTAYEQSSLRVMNTVNARVTDLTDRLSGELTTLASRLPAEVETLNGAMSQIRVAIQKATRSMDEAVNDLARQTPERLKTYLDQLDKELAHAIDRFSGTLGQWDDKIGEVGELASELRRLTASIEKRRVIRLPNVEIPSA